MGFRNLSFSAYDGSLEPDEFELQIVGVGQFIERNTPLGEVVYVREMLQRTKKLELVMVPRSEVVRPKVIPIEREREFFVSTPPTPTEVVSHLEVRNPFSLRVVKVNGIDTSPLPAKGKNSSTKSRNTKSRKQKSPARTTNLLFQLIYLN